MEFSTVSPEVKLCLGLILHGEEVPPKIKENAVNYLKTLSMAIPDDHADSHLIDKLIEAVENDDVEEIAKVIELIDMVYGPSEPEKPGMERIETTDAIDKLIDESVEAFFNAYEEKFPVGLLEKVLYKINEVHIAVPLRFDDNMLITFAQGKECMVVYVINEDVKDLDDVLARWEKIPKADVIDAIREQWGIDDIPVDHMSLEFKLIDDHQFSFVMKRLA